MFVFGGALLWSWIHVCVWLICLRIKREGFWSKLAKRKLSKRDSNKLHEKVKSRWDESFSLPRNGEGRKLWKENKTKSFQALLSSSSSSFLYRQDGFNSTMLSIETCCDYSMTRLRYLLVKMFASRTLPPAWVAESLSEVLQQGRPFWIFKWKQIFPDVQAAAAIWTVFGYDDIIN